MRSWIWGVAGLALIAATINAVSSNAQNQPAADAGRLPGARTSIDAANYPTLQAAIDALPEQGGLVRIPAGEFVIDQPLVVSKSDVTLEGVGGATHIKNANQQGRPAIQLQHPSGKDERGMDLWRIRLADFRVTGNEKSGHGVAAQRINELLVDGVTCSHHGGDGLRLHFCYEDPRICDSLITYNGQTGLALDGCHDIVVSGNQFEENRDALHCFDGFNLCMTGNCLDDHLGDGVVIENTYGSVLSGNMIEECQGRAVVLDRDCYGITLSANVIAHNFSGGVDLRDAHGCAVSANTFTIDKIFGVRIGPSSGRITVSGNNFCDSDVGGGPRRRGGNQNEAELNDAGGLIVDGAEHVAVVGNVFSGVRPAAVQTPGKLASSVLSQNNVIVDTEPLLETQKGASP